MNPKREPKTMKIKNKVQNTIKKWRFRQVWYGGPQCPRNESKFKDTPSEDNLPKEKLKFREIKFR